MSAPATLTLTQQSDRQNGGLANAKSEKMTQRRLADLINRKAPVEARLTSGDTLRGTLTGADKYNLSLNEAERQPPTLIFKGGVLFIRETKA